MDVRQPAGPGSYLAYDWSDANSDGFVQRNEVLLDQGPLRGQRRPQQPGQRQLLAKRIDPDYKAKHDNEVIVGLDRELAPNFAVSAAYTWRRATDLQWIDAQQW